MAMSTLAETGVDEVRNEVPTYFTPILLQACERLLSQRVEVKMKGRKVHDVLNRLHVAMPQPRDGKVRVS
jgi:nucleolar GTP-binding protein